MHAQRSTTYDVEDFDFIRMSTPDINGCHLTKMLPRRLAQKIKNNEVDIYGGSIAFGPRTQYIEFPEFRNNNFKNAFFYPDMTTLKPIPWADDLQRNFKVCEIICDMRWNVDTPLDFHPRMVAQKQIDKLEKLDLLLYSAFEPEFRVFKQDTFEPYSPAKEMYRTLLLSKYQPFFMDAVTKLEAAGVYVNDCSVEFGEAQLEMPLAPSYGITAADAAFRFKEGIKEIAILHNMTASFMTKPFLSESSSGNHYNHSLWYKSTKRNAMYDPEGEDKISDIARFWIGGLLKHLSAISALCCSTVNCYRRLHGFISPGSINWDINDRFCSIRVKNTNEKGTYIENRLPSSAASPYNIMAATIAAGLDGINNKIEPPAKADSSSGVLPRTFEEALNILEKDDVIRDALGSKFVDYFLRIKREADLKDCTSENQTEEEQLNAERHQYFDFI